MHAEAFEFVNRMLPTMSPNPKSVVEFGGRNINGSIRELFTQPDIHYVSIDLHSGDGVDVVGDAEEYQPEDEVDLVVCCEVLEHSPKWKELVKHAYDILRRDGYFLMTCATDPRLPHNSKDGGPNLGYDEYYGNVDPITLSRYMAELGFVMDYHETHRDRGDLYSLVRK